MIDGKTILGIIPARGGSKGLPRKNILPLAGKPLIAWTIEAANGSKLIDRTILSSDDDEIIGVAKSHGVDAPFVRPLHLATDSASGEDVVLHALEKCPGYDMFVLLQPTSPLRKSDDIDSAIKKMLRFKSPCCVSLCRSEKSPYLACEIENERVVPLILGKTKAKNRQDLPATYQLNGAVYVAGVDWYRKSKTFRTEETIGYVMPRERSVDIDEAIDLYFAETLLGYNKNTGSKPSEEPSK